MAIPKKGSRKIVVNSVEYRWYIRRKPTCYQGDYATYVTGAVELLENPGSVLAVTFLWNHYRNYFTEFAITPKDIATAITDALQTGWQPEKPGGTFEFRQTDQVSV